MDDSTPSIGPLSRFCRMAAESLGGTPRLVREPTTSEFRTPAACDRWSPAPAQGGTKTQGGSDEPTNGQAEQSGGQQLSDPYIGRGRHDASRCALPPFSDDFR